MHDKNAADKAKKWMAYRNTIFRAQILDQQIDIKVGSKHATFDLVLKKFNTDSWAFITAYNPKAECLSEADNLLRNSQLLDALNALGRLEKISVFEGEGVPVEGDWKPEKSFLVIGIGYRDAVNLGRLFQQDAIVWATIEQEAQLVDCTV